MLAVTLLLACPVPPVTTVAPPVREAPAPLPGAAKVTVAPETGLPKASRTVGTSGLLKAVLTVAFCPEPEVSTMLAAAPAVLVRLKDAGVATPLADAVTL